MFSFVCSGYITSLVDSLGHLPLSFRINSGQKLDTEIILHISLYWLYFKNNMGQVMKMHLSFYLVLLSFDSKTR